MLFLNKDYFEPRSSEALLKPFFHKQKYGKIEKEMQKLLEEIMNKSWLLVILGAILEIGWVTGLAHAASVSEWTITIISVILSYGLFTLAAKELPMGTLYAVYTGLGTVGTILTGIWLFDEAIYPLKAFLMISLLVGIIGLKMVETKKEA